MGGGGGPFWGPHDQDDHILGSILGSPIKANCPMYICIYIYVYLYMYPKPKIIYIYIHIYVWNICGIPYLSGNLWEQAWCKWHPPTNVEPRKWQGLEFRGSRFSFLCGEGSGLSALLVGFVRICLERASSDNKGTPHDYLH